MIPTIMRSVGLALMQAIPGFQWRLISPSDGTVKSPTDGFQAFTIASWQEALLSLIFQPSADH